MRRPAGSPARARRLLGAALVTAGGALAMIRGGATFARPAPRIVAEPRIAPAPSVAVVEPPELPPPDAPFGPPRPPRKVILPRSRVTPAIARTARDILSRPMGSEVLRTLEDRTYAFVVEPHYHAPESGLTPVGWHKGVTVYALEE